ncbi:MAG: DNA methylase, partial [Lachnospiraceae bacterium]|nr:DNA methylase [Lachnospiraceae bacterium]
YDASNHVAPEDLLRPPEPEQLDLFTDYAALEQERAQEQAELEREKRGQKAVLEIQKKFGKNALLKGMNLEEGATGRERNAQVGGHRK